MSREIDNKISCVDCGQSMNNTGLVGNEFVHNEKYDVWEYTCLNCDTTRNILIIIEEELTSSK